MTGAIKLLPFCAFVVREHGQLYLYYLPYFNILHSPWNVTRVPCDATEVKTTLQVHEITDMALEEYLTDASEYRSMVEVKVKWSRLSPGVAQRVGRGIALLFHDRGTRRRWVVSSTPRPHFTLGKHPVPILQEAGWAPGPVWAGGKSRYRTIQSVVNRYTDWATGPTNTEVWIFQNVVGFLFPSHSISQFWIKFILMKVIRQNLHISCFEFELHCTHLTRLALKASFSQLSPSHIHRWPRINLVTSESRLEITGKFWNVVLETDGGDRLDRSCEKWRSITLSKGGEEYPTYSNKNEG